MTGREHRRWVTAAADALRAVVREPMLWFAAIGVALFLLSQQLDYGRDRVIVISAGDLRQMVDTWQAQMGRSPTRQELAGLVRQRVDEEVLSREALRRGLDKGDVIIRRRLAQKLDFLLADTAEQTVPDDRAARAYFASHQDRYREPPTVSFEQVYFSPDRQGAAPGVAARDALQRLQAGGPGTAVGDPFVLPLQNRDVDPQSLRFDYGAAFVHTLAAAPQGQWSGPIATPFGLHLIRVTARSSGRAADFAAVADRVRDDMMQERRARDNAARMARLRAAYDIRIARTVDVPR